MRMLEQLGDTDRQLEDTDRQLGDTDRLTVL